MCIIFIVPYSKESIMLSVIGPINDFNLTCIILYYQFQCVGT